MRQGGEPQGVQIKYVKASQHRIIAILIHYKYKSSLHASMSNVQAAILHTD